MAIKRQFTLLILLFYPDAFDIAKFFDTVMGQFATKTRILYSAISLLLYGLINFIETDITLTAVKVQKSDDRYMQNRLLNETK